MEENVNGTLILYLRCITKIFGAVIKKLTRLQLRIKKFYMSIVIVIHKRKFESKWSKNFIIILCAQNINGNFGVMIWKINVLMKEFCMNIVTAGYKRKFGLVNFSNFWRKNVNGTLILYLYLKCINENFWVIIKKNWRVNGYM